MSKTFKRGDAVVVRNPNPGRKEEFFSPVVVVDVLVSQNARNDNTIVTMRGDWTVSDYASYWAPIEDVYHVDDPEVTSELCIPVSDLDRYVNGKLYKFSSYYLAKNCVVFKR